MAGGERRLRCRRSHKSQDSFRIHDCRLLAGRRSRARSGGTAGHRANRGALASARDGPDHGAEGRSSADFGDIAFCVRFAFDDQWLYIDRSRNCS